MPDRILTSHAGSLPRPEDLVALDADGQEPRSVGRRVLDALLEAEDVRVEVERLVLVADEHACVEDLLQHGVPPWSLSLLT